MDPPPGVGDTVDPARGDTGGPGGGDPAGTADATADEGWGRVEVVNESSEDFIE
jgi:hypothetical protein